MMAFLYQRSWITALAGASCIPTFRGRLDTYHHRYMMAGMSERGTTVDLLQGTLATLILKSLSWGPLHGYGIARWIEQVTEDELLVEEGSLYPALHRLQARDLVSSQWTISDTNRR